jgi:hypothetical protein
VDAPVSGFQNTQDFPSEEIPRVFKPLSLSPYLT